jgi:hypothetical protein
MLPNGLTSFGKSVIIAAGAAFELVRVQRVPETAASLQDLSNIDLSGIEARIESLSLAVARLRDQWQQLNARLDAAAEGDEERFDRQTRSVEALRAMVGQTDELLQKVLDGLDATGSVHDLAQFRR